jgi:hypothetical protein
MQSRALSSIDLASLLSTTPKTIASYAKAGVVHRLKRGKYDETKSVQGFAKHMRQLVEARTKGTTSVAAERALLLKVQRRRAELALERETGRMVDEEEARLYFTGCFKVLQRHALALPPRINHRIGGERAQLTIIDDEIRLFLNTVAEAKPLGEDLACPHCGKNVLEALEAARAHERRKNGGRHANHRAF